MDYNKISLETHKKYKGKIAISNKVPLRNKDDLSIAYTPGVAQPCIEIHKDKDNAYQYTSKSNLIAVVSDGSAVLGLGNIGASASIPVMEGKCILFKEFGNVDAFPICLDTQDTDEIVRTIKLIEPIFGGINLEDISGPRCFEIEKKLKEVLDIPVFHDDQHGTAVVATAAIINSLKLTERKIEETSVVISGAGAAGDSIARLLLSLNIHNVLVCDSKGIISKNRNDLDKYKQNLAEITNRYNENGTLKDALKNKDIFVGVSAPNIVTEEMVASMNKNSILLPMANPTPEIMPDLAKKAGAYIVGTGRSDFPNQVNNVLAFPGIFRGALDVRASDINEEMKIAAAYAIAKAVPENELTVDNILPSAFHKGLSDIVARSVAEAAVKSKVARKELL